MGAKTSLFLLALLAVILGFARSDFSVSSHHKLHIDFWNGWTGPDGRVALEMIRQFNQENPDVEVSMQRMEWGTYYNKLMVAEVDGRGPAVFVIHASTLPRMEQAGFLADVRDMFEGPRALPTSDFDDYVLNQVKYDQTYVGVPLDIHPQGLYCNADMLKQAGFVDANGNARAPENKEEFVRAIKSMQKLDASGHPDTWGFALTLWRNNFQALIPQFDGRYMDESGNADLDCKGNVEALEFLSSLEKQHLVPPPENGLGWVGYRQKKVAMVWDGVYMLGDLKRLEDMPYIGAPIPVLGHHAGTMADSHVLCIQKTMSPERRDAAERFIRFLSEHSIQWAGAGQVPARKSVRNSAEFAKMPVQYAFSKQIPTMMYPPRTHILFELSLEIDLAVEKVMRGRATPDEALKVANKNCQTFIDRDRRERQAKP